MDRRTILLGSLGLAFPYGNAEAYETQQSGQKRFALILANQTYEKNPLPNIDNDAALMGRTLKALGFTVVTQMNGTRLQMRNKLKELRDGLVINRGAIGFVYYSGHGVQVDGENYLVPINNSTISSEPDVKEFCLSLSYVLEMAKGSHAKAYITVLDACRDNPFLGQKGDGTKGLAVVGRNLDAFTLVAFAASPGETASATLGGVNSIYTAELVKQLQTPNVSLQEVFQSTRSAVRIKSSNKQRPREDNGLEELIFLNGRRFAGGVSPKPEANPEVRLAPTSIRLELLGVPTGAVVKVDDVQLKGNIYTDEIADKSKEVEVSISATGFRPYVGKVTLTRGSASTLPVTMEPKVSESPIPETPETLVDVTRLLRMGGGFRVELAKTGFPGGSAATRNEDAHTTFKPDVELSKELKGRAFKARILVEVEVSATGDSTTTLIDGSGDAEIDKAVLSTLRRWKWVPGYRDGKEVTSKQKFEYIIRIN